MTSLGGGGARAAIINHLKQDGKNVVIFGSGKFAKAAAVMILNNGINVKCFVDEEQYFYEGKTVLINDINIPCILSHDLPNEQETFNIVAGNVDYKRILLLKDKYPNCTWVEYLDACSQHFMDKSFFEQNSKILNEIYDNLQDDESKQVLKAYLYGRYSGDVAELSKLNHCDGLYDWSLLNLTKNDIFLDAGAFTGDTIQEIQKYYEFLPRKIYAVEPDELNLVKLLRSFNPEEISHINVFPFGLFSKDADLHFNSSGTLGSAFCEDGNTVVKVIATDNYKVFNDVSVIKMDIEGSETDALTGSENLIRNNKPKLAICIYHNNQDLINVYKLLIKFNKNYKFYLRQHSNSLEETVLYAI